MSLSLARPHYITSEIYRGSTYGPKHPLAIPRVSTCTDLIRAMGWLDPAITHVAEMAGVAQLTRFHDLAYIQALQQAERDQHVPDEIRDRYRIGADGNPVYREVFSRPATSAGGAGRWPNTGLATDRAGGHARNFPVPRALNDTEHRALMHEAVIPLIQAFAPEAILLQSGADSLEEDPLAKLSLSNNAYWRSVREIRNLAPRLVVVGGGGYNPYTVARCWAGIWATLNDFDIPDRTTPEAETVLRALVYNRAAGRNPPEHWFTTLRDAPREGEVRDEIRFHMITRRHLLAGLSALALLPAAHALAQIINPTAAQPQLPTEKLTILTHDGRKLDFTVEMALTQDQQTVGLMFRTSVPDGTGMLFDWGTPRESNMWMRNTVSSLDMLFIQPDGTISHIAERTVPQSLAVISSGGPVRATIEIAAGAAEKLDIRVGDKVQNRIFGNAS
eukprot:gene12939-13039_t